MARRAPARPIPATAASSSEAPIAPVTIRLAGAAFPARATLNVEPVILLARQREQGLVKGPLDRAQGLLARLLLFGALLLFDQAL